MVVFCLAVALVWSAEGKQREPISVVFRFDDYSNSSPTEVEFKVIEAFRRRGLKLTLAVIPYECKSSQEVSLQDIGLSAEKADVLRRALSMRIIEVAVHGYCHQPVHSRDNDPRSSFSEFVGVPYDIQLAKLSRSKRHLEEILGEPVTTFVPPWNSYDSNTLWVLGKLNFKVISARRRAPATPGISLKFLSTTASLPRLKRAIQFGRTVTNGQPIIVVLFHHFDFREWDPARGRVTYQQFEELLDWLVAQKDVTVRTIEETAHVVGDLSVDRFLANRDMRYSFRQNLMPPFLRNFIRWVFPRVVFVYLSSGDAGQMKFLIRLTLLDFYVGLLAGSVALGFLAANPLLRKYRRGQVLLLYAISVLLILLAAHPTRNPQLFYSGCMALVSVAGFAIGVWNASANLKYRIGTEKRLQR